MAENSKIEWCDHTFNPWTGCTKVSPACANCYAEAWSKRSGHVQWGAGKPRRRTTPAEWRKPVKWDRMASSFYQCQSCGRRDHMADVCRYTMDHPTLNGFPQDGPIVPARPRVFCASLADWLDDEVPIEWLAELLDLIRHTPNLDWLLLTKRPENWARRLVDARYFIARNIGDIHYAGARLNEINAWLTNCPPSNIWIGTTVEDQTRADERIPELLKIPARVRFLSCEPLLGPVDLRPDMGGERAPVSWLENGCTDERINWVIAGGESGPGARPMHPAWARGLRDQCAAAGVPFLFKQWGDWSPFRPHAGGDLGGDMRKGIVQHVCCDRENDGHFRNGDCYMRRVGKKRAGRILDGREWNEFPTP